MITKDMKLLSAITYYRKKNQELQDHLLKYPDDWPRFQTMFNESMLDILGKILKFEKDNLNNFESKVYKLKKIFERRLKHYFLHGDYAKWSLAKPFGYPGDFKIIDDIYQNSPSTTGFARLHDNCFQELSAAKATRERKEDFKKIIFDFVVQVKAENIRIMNLASGPAREIKELLDSEPTIFSKVIFDCYELDNNAITYARQLLNEASNVNFIKKNAIRLALKKDIKEDIPLEYDMIYSTGLFDYLDERIATRLIGNLKKLLKMHGMICISNYRDKYNNPSAYFMEWVTEWNLIYRTENDFRNIFINAGFSPSQIKIIPQKNNVMQYCFARVN